ncbi:MAG: hypothetical protein K0Q79_1821 [Flavipsychrobacter sp.]|jgi:hypothetical protein|nr:hypothetical protein [Flavipsychrobacter sp.]
MQVQYVMNEKGKKTAVQIPLKQWEELQKGIKKLELFNELKQAFKEMEQHGQGKLKTPTTKQLLSQL